MFSFEITTALCDTQFAHFPGLSRKEGKKMDNYIVKNLRHYCNVQRPGCHAITPKPIDFYDLTFTLEGSITYVVDGKEYVTNKNDAIFIRPGMIRERVKSDNPLWYVSFNFDAFDDFNSSLPIYLPGSFSSDMKRFIQVFPYSHILFSTLSKQKVSNLLNYILLELIEKDSVASQNSYVNEILKLIDEKITEKLTLQLISSELKLSKEYISSIFKKETGKTLTNYINEQKMIAAKEFVVNSTMPLAEISEILGFDNYNYFSRLFKKHFDRTPINMRKTV